MSSMSSIIRAQPPRWHYPVAVGPPRSYEPVDPCYKRLGRLTYMREKRKLPAPYDMEQEYGTDHCYKMCKVCSKELLEP